MSFGFQFCTPLAEESVIFINIAASLQLPPCTICFTHNVNDISETGTTMACLYVSITQRMFAMALQDWLCTRVEGRQNQKEKIQTIKLQEGVKDLVEFVSKKLHDKH